MPIHRCKKCGEEEFFPEICKCPYCNKNLEECSPEHAAKHVRKCALKLNPYMYSERRRGRPSRADIWRECGLNIENDK